MWSRLEDLSAIVDVKKLEADFAVKSGKYDRGSVDDLDKISSSECPRRLTIKLGRDNSISGYFGR